MENEDVVDTTNVDTIENSNSLNATEENEIIDTDVQTELTVDDYNTLKEERDNLAKEKTILESKNKQLFERAKKQGEVIGQPTQNLKNNNDLTREEVILIAKGVEEESIVFLKTLQAGNKAMGRNVSLTDLQLDPAFIALSEKKQAENKSARAGLGGSSKGIQTTPDIYKENMTREDHKKLWEKETGNG